MGELARQLAPALDLEPATLERLLGRGALTVEEALGEDEARFLSARLERMGVPAEVVDEDAGLSLSSEPPAQDSVRHVRLFEDEDSDPVSERTSDPEIDPPWAGSTERAHPAPAPDPSAEAGLGAWGALFPDLDQEEAEAPPAASVTAPGPPGGMERSDRAVIEVPTGSIQTARGIGPRGAPDISALEEELVELDVPPEESMQGISGLWRLEPEAETVSEAELLEEGPPRASSPGTLTPPSSPPQPSSAGLSASRSFDGGRLMGALFEQEEGPPYQPEGFDARAPHSATLAAALSVFAPGAGQIYNGDEDEALHFGLRFWMVAPWIEAVRDARAVGEKVATYWAPRPPEGNLLRALRYALGWLICVGALGLGLGWLGQLAHERSTREPPPPYTEDDVELAFEDARIEVREARIAGLDALSAVMDEYTRRGRSTMTDEERSERLFLRGLEVCRARRAKLCAAMMKRVLKFDPRQPDAVRLHTWAALRAQGASQDMPELRRDYPTLEQYELQREREAQGVEADPGGGPAMPSFEVDPAGVLEDPGPSEPEARSAPGDDPDMSQREP